MDAKDLKVYKSEDYNFVFNKKTGFFARWGKTALDDPKFSPIGPEILDIEISTICSKGCPWCYKSNKAQGRNMSFDTFKMMFDKFPKTLTQIAFGIGDIDGNPDLWKIMEYCRINDVIPNITINGERMTPMRYDLLTQLCGAVAVSHYDDDVCYGAVAELSRRGLKQVNIHQLLSEETYDQCRRVMIDSKHDKRLQGLNATVFLMLKPKGERNGLHKINHDAYQDLVDYAIKDNITIGFDSCSASAFLKAVENHSRFQEFKMMSEPCESTLFSYYINVDGKGFPCSFSEGMFPFSGVEVPRCSDFLSDVWNSKEAVIFRDLVSNKLDHNGCRTCPIYDLNLEV